MFGALGRARNHICTSFVSQTAFDLDLASRIGLKNRLVTVQNCRNVSKQDKIRNSYQPQIQVDAQSYEVRADEQLLTCEPATVLPLAQRYFLF